MTYLHLTWAKSRAQNSYGYSVVKLLDVITNKICRCNGGGYDMLGTVVGQWLEHTYQDELLTIKEFAHESYSAGGLIPGTKENYDIPVIPAHRGLYGMRYLDRTNRVQLDGACGLNSMYAVAEKIGLRLDTTYGLDGGTSGFLVHDI